MKCTDVFVRFGHGNHIHDFGVVYIVMLECKTDYDVVFQDALDAFSVAYLRQQRGGSPVGQLAGEYFSVTWKVGEKLLLLIQAPDEAVFVYQQIHVSRDSVSLERLRAIALDGGIQRRKDERIMDVSCNPQVVFMVEHG